MLLNRANLAVVEAASKEDSRYTLKGILCDQEGTTATDGHILCHVTPPPGMTAEGFPVVVGTERPTEPIKPFILPLESAKEVAKALPKKTTIPILKTAMVCRASNDNGKAYISVTDLETSRLFSPDKVSSQFPDWHRVTPKDEDAKFTIGLDGALLERVVAVARALKAEAGDKRDAIALTFRFTDAQSAVKVTATNSEGQSLTAVIMPMRIE